MRSPVIAFSILAAAAVSPNLVAGAPTDSITNHSPRQLPVNPLGGQVPGPNALNNVPAPPVALPFQGLGIDSSKSGQSKPTVSQHRAAEEQLHNPSSSSIDAYSGTSHSKRAEDQYTAGGNSYTGATSDTSGGSTVSESDGSFGEEGEGGFPTIINDGEGGTTAGNAGESGSGFSFGGDGDGKGAGGNSYSGATGPSEGGDVVNSSHGGGGIENDTPNAGGAGGFDESGDSQGGDAAGNVVDGVNTNNVVHRRKRAEDQYTAGGNSYTGASSNVDGGNVINHSNSDGVVFNDAPNTGGNAGETFSGFANGGDGDGYGPGGNAYSGATGSAVGGSVVNSGGFVENEAPQMAGVGGESESGDAQGGDA